jgi:plasmid stabilization system protein ParE
MRRCKFSQSAAAALDNQINYLISVNAHQAARALESRVKTFLSETLCQFPFAGSYIAERDVYESWIPGTRMVVWYKVFDNEIVVAMVWHTSQSRSIKEDNEN